MSSIISRPPSEDLAFEQIEAAVKETSRGRWFLEEFARRHRQADTLAVLDAIGQLQRSVQHALQAAPAAPVGATKPVHARREDVLDMARAIAKAQAEIRSLRTAGETESRFASASDELDGVIDTTEQATSKILSAAERIQEQAWIMREANADATICDLFDNAATEIYTACSFQDMTAQRIRKMVEALQFIDERLKSLIQNAGMTAMMEAEAEALKAATIDRAQGDDIWMSEAHQAEIDETFEFFTPAAASAEPTMVGADALDLDDAPLSMDDILAEVRAETMPMEQPHPAPMDDVPAKPVASPAPVRAFRFESNGPGTPDHDELLEGIVDQPAPAAAAPLSPFAHLDAASLEDRIRAFR